LVYLQYISAKIHSKCASQPKMAKKSLKTHSGKITIFKGVTPILCPYSWGSLHPAAPDFLTRN